MEREHERLRALLRDDVMGEAGWRARRELDRHLGACAPCRLLREELRLAWSALGTALPDATPPVHLKTRVLERFRAEHARPARADRESLWARAVAALRLGAAPGLRPAFAIVLAILVPFAALGILGLRPASPAFAAATTLTIVRGSAELSSDGGVAWAGARDLARLGQGERVRVSAGGQAVITFFDGTTVSLGPLADVAIETLSRGDGPERIALAQHAGASWISVTPARTPVGFALRTSSVSASARGTAFETVVSDGVTTLRAHEGEVDLDAAGRTLRLRAGEVAVVRLNEPPAIATATDRVRLSLRASVPLLAVDPLGLACGTASDGSLVRQLPRCLVDKGTEGATIGTPAIGRFIVALRGGRERHIELRVTLTDAGVTQELSVETESSSGDLSLTSFELESGPDGRLVLSRVAPFTRVDSVPARIVLRSAKSGPTLAPADPTERPRTESPRPTDTPEPTRTAAPRTPEPTETPEPSRTPEPTRSPSPSPSPSPSSTPSRTPEPTRTP